MRAVVIAVVCLLVVGSRAEARYPVLRKPVIQYAALPWSITHAAAMEALAKLGAKPTSEATRRYVAGRAHVEHHDRERVKFVVAGWTGSADFHDGVLRSVSVSKKLTAAQVRDERAALEGRFGPKDTWGGRLEASVAADGQFLVVYRRP